MIVLFTDYGLAGPYTGQVRAVLHRDAPGEAVIDLFADLPPFDAKRAAYLLVAYAAGFPVGTVFLCVVDPGVGGDRDPVAGVVDGCWFVGPDNGIFELVVRRSTSRPIWTRIAYRPDRVSATFHGRDVFAPVAARLAQGLSVPGERELDGLRRFADWPDDLAEIAYVDHFGNAITGCRAASIPRHASIIAGGQRIFFARTFSAVQKGQVFCYENANGLLEFAVNQGRADTVLGLSVGSSFIIDTNVSGNTSVGGRK